MAEYLGTPRVQYFDTTTGDPLVGGKLYTYNSDFITPRATYPTLADAAAGTNANANPVVLDSRGEADVVVSGSTGLILKNADGTLLWTKGPVGATGSNIYDPNGNEIIIASYVTSAVNEVTISNAATGDSPSVLATGGDTNINFTVKGKGTGGIDIGTKIIDTNKNEMLTMTAVASAVNYFDITNSATAVTPTISAVGDDTNIGINITPKGTGVIKLGLIKHPTAVGTAGQYVTLSGTDTLQFTTLPVTTGSIIQTVTAFKSDIFSSTVTNSVVDITGMAATITPSNSSNKVKIDVGISFSASAVATLSFVLYRNAVAIGQGDAAGNRPLTTFSSTSIASNSGIQTLYYQFYDSPSTTSATTYKLSVTCLDTSLTFYVNRSPSDTNSTGFSRVGSSFALQEIKG